MLNKTVCMCNYCIQAIESRGEELWTSRFESMFEDAVCDWCHEPTPVEEMRLVKFLER